jgi:hypothetical protein
MTDYGTEKTTSTLNGNEIADVVKYRRGEIAVRLRNYRVKVKVVNAQDEMSEFIRFTDELAKLRQQGKLTVDKDDATTFPAFIIQYPREDVDGSYFIIKSYTVVV